MILWGIIAYKLLGFRHDYPTESLPSIADSRSEQTKTSDTLQANYRDPFLGERATQMNKPTPVPFKPPPKDRPPKVAPSIVWSGTLRKHNTSYYIVTLNDTPHMIRAGDAIGSFTLKQVSDDSIIFQQGSYRYAIKRP